MIPATLKDKIPPHNSEAEQAVLGALLLDPDAVPQVLRFLRPDDFYVLANKKVFKAIISLYEKGQKADLITLTDELKLVNELDLAGGAGYVAGLTSLVPTSANVEYYAEIVQENSTRRNLLKIASEILASAHDDTQESRLVIEDAQKRIFDVTQSNQTFSYKSVKEILPKTIEAIERLYHTKDAYTGIPSGFADLDNMTSGFQNSELIVVGARPSVGKTAFALTMAQHASVELKIPVGFFTLEMSDMALMQRLIASEARIPSEKLRTGLLKPADFDQLMDAAGRIYDSPLYIVDMPYMKLLDLRTQARRLKSEQNVRILYIDYITLISSENLEIPRHEQVAEISRSLKALARELEIPIVVLSQLKRETEGKRPTLSDIRESGSIEQDADLVMFLHRERETERKPEDRPTAVETELIIAKQRNGPVGTVEIVFLPAYTRFESLEKGH